MGSLSAGLAWAADHSPARYAQTGNHICHKVRVSDNQASNGLHRDCPHFMFCLRWFPLNPSLLAVSPCCRSRAPVLIARPLEEKPLFCVDLAAQRSLPKLDSIFWLHPCNNFSEGPQKKGLDKTTRPLMFYFSRFHVNLQESVDIFLGQSTQEVRHGTRMRSVHTTSSP